MNLWIYLSIYVSIYPSIYLPVYLSIYIFYTYLFTIKVYLFIFSFRHIWKHVLIFFGWFFFQGSCFKFYLIAVLICFLYFIIHRRCIRFLEHCGGCLFWPSLLLLTLNLARIEAWVVPETLCILRWCAGVFSTFEDSSVINF